MQRILTVLIPLTLMASLAVPVAGEAATVSVSAVELLVTGAMGPIVRGTGAGALIGGDRTNPGDDGNEAAYNPPADFGNFAATFFASEKQFFDGGEGAFNVFDNQVGGGNAKWCCGSDADFPHFVGADFGPGGAFALERFTVTSGNDASARDPRVWSMQGSNDGVSWDDIFSHSNTTQSLWEQLGPSAGFSDRNLVLEFVAGDDFPIQATNYQMFRMFIESTGLADGARLQLNEIELFGNFIEVPIIPEPSSWMVWSLLGFAGLGFSFWRRRR